MQAPTDGKFELRRGLEHYAFGRAFAAVCGIVTVVALVRLMPVSEYAIYTAASAAVSLAAAFAMLGLDRVAMRFIPIGRVAARSSDLYPFILTLVGVRVLAISLIALLFVALDESIGVFLQIEGDHGAVLRPMLIYMVGVALSECLISVLQSLMRQEWLRRAISVQWGMRLAFVIGAAIGDMEMHAWHALWAWAISEALFALIMLRAVHVSIREREVTNGDDRYWHPDRVDVLRTAAANYMGSLAALPWQLYTLRVVAAAILTTNELAAYGFFQSLIERIRAYLPAQFLQGIAEPLLSSAIVRGRDPMVISDYFGALLNMTAWVIIPLLLGVALAGDNVIDLLTGGKFGEYSPVLAILLLQILLGTPVTLLWSALSVTGRAPSIARSLILPTLVFYPVLVFAGLNFGALGMAVVGVVNVVAIRILMSQGLSATKLSVKFSDECIIRISWATTVALLPALFVILIPTTVEPYHLVGVCALSAVLYVLLGLRFPPLSASQLTTLIRILPWSARVFDRTVVGALSAEREPAGVRK